ncbi:hypothetical protein FXO37_25699 [Capsicum annuum]|nr:hypothetical protein FXO37_25699 [Capsicum annuum]
MVVELTTEDIKAADEHWSTALIVYVLVDTPYEKSMDNFVKNVWNFVKKSKIPYHNEGYYVFQFETVGDRAEILQKRLYTYHNKPFILKPWVLNFVFDIESITTLPLWVNFHELPVGYWSQEDLSKVASAVEKPLNADKYTVDMTKIYYARVLIEMDISHPMVDMIVIETIWIN